MRTPFQLRAGNFIAITVLLATSANSAQAADDVSWPALEQRIDQKIETMRQDYNIVGMTVAVTKDGRLIHSKGYGRKYISTDGGIELPMERQFRTRIGSVSKAVVTGPAAYKLLKKKNIDPRTKKLYGANSIFGSEYSTDISIGSDRYYPIVGMAINKDDQVFTWYADGKVSVGSSDNLTRHLPPRTFSRAEDTRIEDIRAIAISSRDKVYTWYDNGGLTIGQSRDLDYHKGFEYNSDGGLITVKMPLGKSMLNVVGIAIAKSNDHVYVWYDDGTLSSGTSRDFTRYFVDRYYVPARNWGWRYNTRAIAIAANDRVYAWYSDGKASSGKSNDFELYRSVYNYSSYEPARRNPYKQITVQHLFDHYSGFQRNGDGEGASTMFYNTLDGEEPSYDHIHQHFLRTRPLKWAPGEAYSYSNHGMGLFTLIIKRLSGKSYRQYTVNNYLSPMGLKGTVRPQKANPDANDALAYQYDWDSDRGKAYYTHMPFKDSTTGLAAGGWMASAEGLLAITRKLNEQYSFAEIDSFGWKKESRGKLHHDGLTGGGAAYVVMFPQGYRSNSGKNLSGVHVAIAANTTLDRGPDRLRGVTGAMDRLASEIALAVPDSSVPSDFSLWPGRSNPN
ncbi:MAG: serine hydrolase domain-containing protein [Pseudomonadota bacterium]